MTVTIALRSEEEKKLVERAAACGLEVAAYVQLLIKRDIEQPPFAELFAPVHQAVRDSGVRESELDSVIQTAIANSRRERRAKQAP